MADALRKTTIEIDWKVNNNALQRANEETDKLLLNLDAWRVVTISLHLPSTMLLIQ